MLLMTDFCALVIPVSINAFIAKQNNAALLITVNLTLQAMVKIAIEASNLPSIPPISNLTRLTREHSPVNSITLNYSFAC